MKCSFYTEYPHLPLIQIAWPPRLLLSVMPPWHLLHTLPSPDVLHGLRAGRDSRPQATSPSQVTNSTQGEEK